MEKWFHIYAYNRQSYFGYGTTTELSAFIDILHRRNGKHYSFQEIDNPERLEALNSGRDTDGFELMDEIRSDAEQRQQDF